MASVVKIKRTSVKGKVPTLSNITAGELALNIRDGRIFSANTTHTFELGSNPHNLTVGTGGVSFANGAYSFPNADGSLGQVLKTNGSGQLQFGTVEVSGGTLSGMTMTGNTIFSGNATFQSAVVFNQPVSSTSEFNFSGPVTFTGDAAYQGTSRHTANVAIRASLAVQQYDFTANTGQTLFKGTSDSQGLFNYTQGSVAVYKDGVRLRPVVDFAETDSSTITLQDGVANNNIITIEQYGSETFAHFNYVATAGQTTFSGADAQSKTLAYTVQNPLGGGVKVYLNGLRLRANTDFTATNGTEVVLLDGAGNNDIVMIESLGPYPYKSFEFVGTNGQTTFFGSDVFGKQLEYEVEKTTVYLNGVKLTEGTDFSGFNGERIIFQEPVSNNDVITIDSHGPEPAVLSAQNEVHYANTTVLKTKEILSFDDLSATVIDQFPAADFVSAQYLIQATNQNGVSFGTFNVIHDLRGNSFISEFGRLNSNGSIMTVTTDVEGGLVRLKLQPATTATKLKIQATRLRKSG